MVDKAIENLHHALSEHNHSDSTSKRSYQRFENDHMIAKFKLLSPPQEMLHQAPIKDVSASGMRISAPNKIEIKKGNKIEFKIFKSANSEPFLSGTGEVARIDETSSNLEIGIHFLKVAK